MRYWLLDALVFDSANPAAMSQTKAGNLVSGMRSVMGLVTGRRMLRQLATPMTAIKKPDQIIHCGKRFMEMATMDTLVTISHIGTEKRGPPKANCWQ